ncbi:methyl-CpG-binding domain-containing protein 2-like [Solanum stenotomum]|uniref:methyl-CpG-binding domain-containing protein 2-like n=1 Tax=Solanum stenotomum TaxID=172797 RepID=UPI0020D0CBD7|nr:methyl-CpG-binding domain-containing protein 2-like [Solanum stenotomum]
MDQNVSHGVERVNNMKPPNSPGEFVVECARCFKWRYIPSKEKYEEIREHNLERPFYCEITREWHSNKKCDDPPDVTEDESGLKWAIDAPNIPQPPPGWECLIKFRTNRVSRYYKRSSPSEKTTLRSSIEVEKYVLIIKLNLLCRTVLFS